MNWQGQYTSVRMRFSLEDVERMSFDSATGEDLSRSPIENPSIVLLGMTITDNPGSGTSGSGSGTATGSHGGSSVGVSDPSPPSFLFRRRFFRSLSSRKRIACSSFCRTAPAHVTIRCVGVSGCSLMNSRSSSKCSALT